MVSFGNGIIRSILVLVITLTYLAGSAFAQPAAESPDPLSRAVELYETRMEAVRRQVRDALGRKLDAADKDGKVDVERVRTVNAESEAFTARGAWPDINNLKALRQDAASAAEDLRGAYRRALKQASKRDDNPLADALAGELDILEHHSDTVPWGKNLADGWPEEKLTVSPGGEPFVLPVGKLPSFRLELRARRLTDTGRLLVSVPVDGGKALTLPAEPSARGDCRVLVSVDEAVIAASLGVARPIEAGNLKAAPPGELRLVAEHGSFIVELVRTKPLIEGTPEAKEKKSPQSPPKNPARAIDEAAPPADELRVGMELIGSSRNRGEANPQGVRATVKRITPTEVVIHTKNRGPGYTDYIFKRSGNTLTVVDADAQGGPWKMRLISGSGELAGSTITWNCEYQHFKGQQLGRTVKTNFSLTKDD